MYTGLPTAPYAAHTRSLVRRARRAPSKDPASIESPRLLKELLFESGTILFQRTSL